LTRVVSTSSRLHRIVVLIWFAFFLRGAFCASILPVWEGFDEYAHFAFIHHLKTFGTLPRKDELVSAEISRSLKLVPLPWSLNKWQFPAQHPSVFGSLVPLWRILGSAPLSRIREFHQCRNPRKHRLVSVCRSGL